MLKFLRRYNKWILVVGGALLMVAFLLPQTLQEMSRGIGARTTYMRIDGERISALDYERASREMVALQEMNLLPRGESIERWILVTHEAALAGLVGGPEDGRDILPTVASDTALTIIQQRYQNFTSMFLQMEQGRKELQQLNDQALMMLENTRAGISRQNGMSLEIVDTALAKFRGYHRLESLYRGVPARVSDRRTLIEGRDNLDSARIDYVFIPGDHITSGVAEPDDAALAAQFEQYKNFRPGESDNGIGYTLPARVKLEWITLDRTAWSEKARVDPLEVRQRYLRQNKDKPATGPEFDAARAGIEAQIRKETADRVMNEANKAIRAEIAKATLKVDRDGDYYKLPQDWAQRRPDLSRVRAVVAERVRTETGIDIGAPAVETRTDAWQTADDLATLPGIGQAFLRRGNVPVGFPDLVMRARELAGPNSLGVQVGVPYGPLEDAAGHQFYVTITDARKESPPDAWSDIREKLVADYKRLEGFKVLERDAATYTQRAIEGGLEAITKESAPTPLADTTAAETTLQVRSGVEISRRGGGTSEINSEAFREAVLDAASQLDPTVDIKIFDPAKRILGIPITKSLGLAVVNITAYTPMTIERYRTSDMGLAMQLQSEAFKDVKDDPFSLKRLKERFSVEMPDKRGGEEKTAEDGAGA